MLFGVISCASNKPVYKEGLGQYIVGTWAETVDKNGKIYFYDTYFPNGQFHAYGYTDTEDANSYFFADGSWEIKNGESCITINYSSDNSFNLGERWCDKIVKINKSVFVFNDGQEDVTMFRVTDGNLK